LVFSRLFFSLKAEEKYKKSIRKGKEKPEKRPRKDQEKKSAAPPLELTKKPEIRAEGGAYHVGFSLLSSIFTRECKL